MSTPDDPEPIRFDARLAIAVVALLAFAGPGPIAGLWIADRLSLPQLSSLLIASAVPCVGIAAVTFAAWRFGWARRAGFVACAVLLAAADVLTLSQLQALRERSKGKAVLSALRQYSSAIDQFFLEKPEKLFVAYDDVVGATRYLKTTSPVAGEDYRQIFPRRRDDPVALAVVMPGGTRIAYTTDFPVPADGPNTQRLRDGSQFETTYRGGRAEGAFRWIGSGGAMRASGTFVDGWPHGPVTTFDRAGRPRSRDEYPRPRVFVRPDGTIDLSGPWSLHCFVPSARTPKLREIRSWDMEIRDDAGKLTAVLTSRNGRQQREERLTGTREGRTVRFSSPLPNEVGALAGALQADNRTLSDGRGDWVARPLR